MKNIFLLLLACSLCICAKAQINPSKIRILPDYPTINTLKQLLAHFKDKPLFIDLWATWCVPCVQEFPDLVTINHMYRDRDFKMITISSDEIKDKDKALNFLQKRQSSTLNYIYSGDSKYKLIEAIDPKWQGALPYTALIEPGGKVVYSKEGAFNADTLKKEIINNPLIGRIYKEQ